MATVPVKDRSGVKLASVSLSTDLAARLKEDILSGKLADRQKLTEQTICEQYEVSRTPVREALAKLEAEGLVENIPNRGAFVHSMTSQDWIDDLTLRKLYEVQAVTWAIERISDEEMDALEETFEFMEFYTLKNDIEKMLNINRDFHRIIYEASHNRTLSGFLTSHQPYFKHAAGTSEENHLYLDQLLEEHRAIYEAFRDKDKEGAIAAMTRHMDNFIERHLPKYQDGEV